MTAQRQLGWLAVVVGMLAVGGCDDSSANGSGGSGSADCHDDCTREGARACDDAGENGYEVCGQWDEDACLEWGPVNPCEGYQSCELGVCTPECSDDCDVVGTSRCVTTPQEGVEVCSQHDDDPCWEWGGFAPCNGEPCVGGACGSACVDECPTVGEQVCDGDGYRSCGDHDADPCREWSAVVDCDGQCHEGQCVDCIPEGEPCEKYADCCDCFHCCPVLHVCVPDWWDSDC